MFPRFDRSRLCIKPLAERQHDLDLSVMLPLDAELPSLDEQEKRGQVPFSQRKKEPDPFFPALAKRLVEARERGSARILAMGAHVIRAGVSRFLIDMMGRGHISHIAMNGAGPIHDWEFALIGATTESVARYIQTGEFGLWQETGRLNDVIRRGAEKGMGMGEAIGRTILEGDFPHKDISVLAAGVRLGVPVTVHSGIGYDIIHEHPNCSGTALGQTSYTDFLIFAESVRHLEGGVFLCFGSAVMGPEVYLKALSMSRNVAHQEGKEIRHFTTAVFDLLPLAGDYHHEPTKDDPRYFYRPWKTILVRTVADGGESFYMQGNHRQTIPHLSRLCGQNEVF